MRKFIIILSILFVLSCKSNEPVNDKSIKFKIWEITDYTISGTNLMGDLIKEGFIINNLTTNQTYIQLLLSEQSTKDLETQWSNKYKKLELEEFSQLQEITYDQEYIKLTIKDIKTDYVIKGNKTDKLSSDINNKIYSSRRGESSGAFALLYRIWNPHFMDSIPLPKLKKDETFNIDKSEDKIVLTDENITIVLIDNGIHQWIGD